MIQICKIFTGIGVDKRFGIDLISTLIELFGSLTHPPPENEQKNPNFSGKQSIKKYPEIMLIPTRFVGVNFCIKEVS